VIPVTFIPGTPHEDQDRPFMVARPPGEGPPEYIEEEQDAVARVRSFAAATLYRRTPTGWERHPATGFNGPA
jgi:hypothetical protein